ncbi:nose resistant to fluoxetine protein 6-like [Chelonus insularis]|uniref:nose resistant to fluoxetine protein 6-like n=1 Tax=Chelonus insularis TaxID=460826 RepID=UPI00158EE010|nr:nose resistant to fluoxetine protein 6-like [Chelonus insularis]
MKKVTIAWQNADFTPPSRLHKSPKEGENKAGMRLALLRSQEEANTENCLKYINRNDSNLSAIQYSKVYGANESINEKIVRNLSVPVVNEKINSHIIEESNQNSIVSEIPWYLKVPLLPILFASSPTLPEGKCKRQAERYLQDLKNGTLWAVRMFDSSTKYPEGIIAGQTRHLGNFDECYGLKANVPSYSSSSDLDVIQGKYCLVRVEYKKFTNSDKSSGPYTLDFDLNSSAWDAIKEKGDFRRVKRYKLELALCVPDTCHETEIETALQEPLEKFATEHQILINVRIKGHCQTRKDEPEFSTLAKIYCYGLLSLIVLVIMSTWYDKIGKVREEDSKSFLVEILLCFSASRNYKSITEVSYKHPGLDSIHLLRTIYMCIAIVGHRMMQYYTNPIVNSEYLEQSYTFESSILIYNGPIIVEAFFAFGGLLLAYHLLIELDKKKNINFISAILIRYFRLTPSYLILIMFITLILPHLGSGPYWNYKIGFESEACASSWWANILYINNYVNTDKLCMFQSWYLSVDYHLYIIALFVIYYFWKMPRKLGYPFIVAIILLGCLIPFCITYFNNVQPIFKGLPYMHEVKDDPYFIQHYIKTHERLATYFVGVLAGAIIYDYGLTPKTIPTYLLKVPFISITVLLGIMSQILGQKFYNPNINPSSFETALYASLCRPIFALAVVSAVIFLTIDNGFCSSYRYFKPRWAQPMSRLTYGAYLIHHINQSYDIGVARHARTFSAHNILWDLVPDIGMSFFLSFILALLVEGPFRRIEKRFIIRQLNSKIINKAYRPNEATIKKKKE